jgi:hypothetical protein
MSTQRDEKEMKGCFIVFGILFIIQSLHISITLIFGGNIYSDLSNLRTNFFIVVISLVIYLYYYWINKKK